jgi:L-rhamnose mutarotase
MNRRFCFALDLKGDPALIAEYRKYHEKIWPEITQGLRTPVSRIWKFTRSAHACS